MHPHIEKYLQQVKGQLRNLSAERREEEVREIGQHLQALVEEGKGRGLGENEAVKAALSQFGHYRRVGRDLNRAVRNKAPHRLPRALWATTFLMIAQALLGLCAYLVLLVPTNWNYYLQYTGGLGGALWRIGLAVFISSLAIRLAFSLRKLRPWAFWLALILMSYHGVSGIMGLYRNVIDLTRLANLSSPILFLTIGIDVLNIIPRLTTLFCLTILVLNRKTYFRMSRVRWSG